MDAQSRFVSVESVLDEEAMTTSLDGLKAEKDTLTPGLPQRQRIPHDALERHL